ncbi:MAG: hypothetical protein EOO41_00155, partial [Methanobacteriota archaeon]
MDCEPSLGVHHAGGSLVVGVQCAASPAVLLPLTVRPAHVVASTCRRAVSIEVEAGKGMLLALPAHEPLHVTLSLLDVGVKPPRALAVGSHVLTPSLAETSGDVTPPTTLVIPCYDIAGVHLCSLDCTLASTTVPSSMHAYLTQQAAVQHSLQSLVVQAALQPHALPGDTQLSAHDSATLLNTLCRASGLVGLPPPTAAGGEPTHPRADATPPSHSCTDSSRSADAGTLESSPSAHRAAVVATQNAPAAALSHAEQARFPSLRPDPHAHADTFRPPLLSFARAETTRHHIPILVSPPSFATPPLDASEEATRSGVAQLDALLHRLLIARDASVQPLGEEAHTHAMSLLAQSMAAAEAGARRRGDHVEARDVATPHAAALLHTLLEPVAHVLATRPASTPAQSLAGADENVGSLLDNHALDDAANALTRSLAEFAHVLPMTYHGWAARHPLHAAQTQTAPRLAQVAPTEDGSRTLIPQPPAAPPRVAPPVITGRLSRALCIKIAAANESKRLHARSSLVPKQSASVPMQPVGMGGARPATAVPCAADRDLKTSATTQAAARAPALSGASPARTRRSDPTHSCSVWSVDQADAVRDSRASLLRSSGSSSGRAGADGGMANS